jgi:N-acetylglucosamine kinase-like BadF-type ATPase
VAAQAVLGVDGGNTKTIALVAAFDGTVLGAGRAGCADIYTGAELAVDEIMRAVGAALEQASLEPRDLGAAVFSLAGADWPEDFAFLRETLAEHLGSSTQPTVLNDAIGALRCGIPDGVGVSVVCGTGAAIGSRGTDGSVFHIGFWPDLAGARQLGIDGLNAVYRGELGLGPGSTLQEAALALFGAPTALDVLHMWTVRGDTRLVEPAVFAPAVLDAAAAGDAVADGIVRSHARVLADQAAVCAGRVQLPRPYPLVLTGSVMRHPAGQLEQLIAEQVEDGSVVPSRFEPAGAAVLEALDEVAARRDAADRLAETMPGRGFFETRTAAEA